MERRLFVFLARVRALVDKKKILIGALLLTSSCLADGQKDAQMLEQDFLKLPVFDLEWVSPPPRVVVGDQLRAKIEAQVKENHLGPGLQVKMPPAAGEPLDLGFDVSEKVEQVGDQVCLRVSPLKAGNLSIPSLGIVDASGKFVARTNPIQIEVVSAIPKDDPKPKESEPLKPPLSLGFPVATLIALGVLVLALFAGGVFAIVGWIQKRKSEITKPVEPLRSEDERALIALVHLEKKGYLKAGQFKPHYFGVSEILKRYMGERYGFEAAESTTEELLSALREEAQGKGLISSEALELLTSMFERLDRVKFTDHIPVAFEGVELLEEAKKVVMMTRRPPPVVATGKLSGGQPNASR